MIENNGKQIRQCDINLSERKFNQELFDKIKIVQSLPDEVVKKFLLSKGTVKRKNPSMNFLPDEK